MFPVINGDCVDVSQHDLASFLGNTSNLIISPKPRCQGYRQHNIKHGYVTPSTFQNLLVHTVTLSCWFHWFPHLWTHPWLSPRLSPIFLLYKWILRIPSNLMHLIATHSPMTYPFVIFSPLLCPKLQNFKCKWQSPFSELRFLFPSLSIPWLLVSPLLIFRCTEVITNLLSLVTPIQGTLPESSF